MYWTEDVTNMTRLLYTIASGSNTIASRSSSMETSDQTQPAWINLKGLTDFTCTKKQIEEKVPVYRFPTIATLALLKNTFHPAKK